MNAIFPSGVICLHSSFTHLIVIIVTIILRDSLVISEKDIVSTFDVLP